jgi:hypothetical protein
MHFIELQYNMDMHMEGRSESLPLSVELRHSKLCNLMKERTEGSSQSCRVRSGQNSNKKLYNLTYINFIAIFLNFEKRAEKGALRKC